MIHNSKFQDKAWSKQKKNSTKVGQSPSKPKKNTMYPPPTFKDNGSSSKINNKQQKKKTKINEACIFHGKYGKSEADCWEKLQTLDDSMKKKNISTRKGHALMAQVLSIFINHVILDSWASHHMTCSQYFLPYTSHSNISKIIVDESTQLEVFGSDTMELTNGCINNVLLVPKVYINLLSIYQICNFGDEKTMDFTPN